MTFRVELTAKLSATGRVLRLVRVVMVLVWPLGACPPDADEVVSTNSMLLMSLALKKHGFQCVDQI